MDILTGDKNLDMEILMKLKDHELGPVCQANKYINSLCKTPIFWYNRMIKKIEESYQENLKLNKKIKKFEVNGLKLEKMKDYFGFDNLQELNNFLNEFHINALYSLYVIYDVIANNLVDSIYTFDDTKLPKYINKKELIFYLRREFSKNFYKHIGGKRIKVPSLHIDRYTPGYIYKTNPYILMPDDSYEINKSIGIRT